MPNTGPGAPAQLPVILNNNNFAKGAPGQPTLLSLEDARTLFHEFGHGLHHMLTRVDELAVSGIAGVEWDAVELPSQFMENFCWEWDVLKHMTAHFKTGTPLPRELFDKMLAARNFQRLYILARCFDLPLGGRSWHKQVPVRSRICGT